MLIYFFLTSLTDLQVLSLNNEITGKIYIPQLNELYSHHSRKYLLSKHLLNKIILIPVFFPKNIYIILWNILIIHIIFEVLYDPSTLNKIKILFVTNTIFYSFIYLFKKYVGIRLPAIFDTDIFYTFKISNLFFFNSKISQIGTDGPTKFTNECF